MLYVYILEISLSWISSPLGVFFRRYYGAQYSSYKYPNYFNKLNQTFSHRKTKYFLRRCCLLFCFFSAVQYVANLAVQIISKKFTFWRLDELIKFLLNPNFYNTHIKWINALPTLTNYFTAYVFIWGLRLFDTIDSEFMQITFFQHHEITLQLSGGEEFMHMESMGGGG